MRCSLCKKSGELVPLDGDWVLVHTEPYAAPHHLFRTLYVCRHCPCPVFDVIDLNGATTYHDCEHVTHDHIAEIDQRLCAQLEENNG